LIHVCGRTERLAEIRADLDRQAAAAREALAGWSGRTAVMGTASPDGGMEICHADFEPFEGVLLADLGLEPAPVLAGLEPFATLSAERVGDVDADLAVLIQYGDNPIDELTASPLWKPGTVVTVPSSHAYLGPCS
jgi:ABC-type Fe3+-hydroxamate transport system substrate-binding protein